MAELLEAQDRKSGLRHLLDANDKYKNGSIAALDEIGELLDCLVNFYPVHIVKEDKAFFYPCMEYFTKQELDAMLDQFWDFDRKLIHEKYSHTIAGWKRSGGRALRQTCRISEYAGPADCAIINIKGLTYRAKLVLQPVERPRMGKGYDMEYAFAPNRKSSPAGACFYSLISVSTRV